MTPGRAGCFAAAALVWTLAASACSAAPADSLATRPALLSRRDAYVLLGAAAATALVSTQDERWSRELSADDSPRARNVARAAKQLGNHLAIAPALLATDALARLTRHDRLAAATERVALACASAGVVTVALKEACGRLRPDQSDDPARFEPFSGHDSFPSGHTTMAFSLAAALDAETRTRWVPAVLYPAATLTAWSRVRDRKHWPSDVAAGAAIGGWVAYRADRWAQRRLPDGLWVVVMPQRRGASVRVGAAF